MAVPIVCFVGRSNSGKTTLIERVIPELVQAGYKVATENTPAMDSISIRKGKTVGAISELGPVV